MQNIYVSSVQGAYSDSVTLSRDARIRSGISEQTLHVVLFPGSSGGGSRAWYTLFAHVREFMEQGQEMCLQTNLVTWRGVASTEVIYMYSKRKK